MEEEKQPQEKKGYEPRPAWQVWGARIGLVLFILLVILQLLHMVGGFR